MKIGIYVGSFNPVHKGHKHVIDYLLQNKYLDKVIIIPTGEYWDKNNLINIEHRIKMLKFYENEKIIINDKLNNIPYTYQLLNELKTEYPQDELLLIIGADNLSKFHLWKNIDEILENKVIVLQRNNIDIKKYINEFKQKDKFILIEEFKYLDISSTQIRNLIQNNKQKLLNKYLDSKISHYIINNNLYGGK